MSPEYLVELPEPALALELPDAEGRPVACYPHPDEHRYVEAALGYGELQGVGVAAVHVADLEGLAATVHGHAHAVARLQGLVQQRQHAVRALRLNNAMKNLLCVLMQATGS